MIVNRRRVLAMGAVSALAPALPVRTSARAAAVDVLRVCNTDYYPAARRLFDLTPGARLEIRFDHDPAFVEQPSAGLWLDGQKVGDAPRRSRQWLGRMLGAGRRLTARVEEVRGPTDDDGATCLARIEMDPDPEAPPVPLGDGYLWAETAIPSVAGDRLPLALGPAPWGRGEVIVGLTAGGEPAGRLGLTQDRMARRMIEARLPLVAEVGPACGPTPRGAGVRLWLAG